VFSDQIPFWVKIGFMKVLYAEFELAEVAKRRSAKAKQRGYKIAEQTSQAAGELLSHNVPDAEEGDSCAGEMDGQTQKRGADPSGDKCRVTSEARQGVTGWFGGSVEPGEAEEVRGHILDSILVVKGSYARLNNISDDHKFIEEEIFYVGDEKIVHRAGANTRGLLRSYVELRKKRPEIFKGLVIMQQPAAYMDEITTVWAITDLAERAPHAVHQRAVFRQLL